MVKCPYCKKEFNKDKVANVHVKNRYYHAECYEKFQSDDVLVEKIQNKAKSLFGSHYSYAKVAKQIRSLQEQGKSLESIFNAIVYWYDVKDGDTDKANGGIGIIEYIYPESERYWKEKREDKEKNLNADYASFLLEDKDEFVISPKPFRKPKRVRLFKLVQKEE